MGFEENNVFKEDNEAVDMGFIDSKKTMSWLCGLLVEDNYIDDAKDLLLVPPVRIGGGEPVAVAMGICCWVLDASFFFFNHFNIYFEQLK